MLVLLLMAITRLPGFGFRNKSLPDVFSTVLQAYHYARFPNSDNSPIGGFLCPEERSSRSFVCP
jgi:hypothetical protein